MTTVTAGGLVRCSTLVFACLTAVLVGACASKARAQSGHFIFVPNAGSNTLSVIDTGSGSVVSTITGVAASPAVAVRGDQAFAYATESSANSVAVINVGTGAVVTHIPVGTSPFSITITPNGRTVYAGSATGVSVIDTATNAVTNTIAIPGIPGGITVTPDGKTVYFSASGNSISVINTTTNAVTQTITLPPGTDSFGMSVTPDGKTLYVASPLSAVITPIDVATHAVGTPIPVGPKPLGVAITPDGRTVIVANADGASVTLIDIATNTPVATILVGLDPSIAAFSPDGRVAYVANFVSNTVTPITMATGTAGTSFPVGVNPGLLSACTNGNALLAAGSTFMARSSGALHCTLPSGPTGSPGPIFSGGTLQFLAGGVSSNLPITLQSAGGTIDTNGFNAVLSGGISGSGGLTKAGLGTLTLGGTSTYAGATNVTAGTLQALAANSLSPNSAFVVGAGAVLDLNNANQVIGSLSGAGSVLLGTASLTAGGDNSSTTFSGAITGAGSLIKTGTGTFALNGALAGTAIVNGGTLAGTGTLGGLSVAAGGAIAPGNSIGTINVNGNAGFAPGSIYVVEINPQGQADRIVATGTATISGGTVQIVAEPGSYTIGTRYVILSAGGGLIGSFDAVTSNLGSLPLTLIYGASNLNVVVGSSVFAAPAHTENQLAVARALDAQVNPSSDLRVVNQALLDLSAPQARAAYDQVAGAAYGNMVMSGLTMRRMFGRALDERLMQEQGSAAARASAAQPGNAQFALAGTAGQDFAPLLAAASATDGVDTSTGWHTWVKGLGQFNRTSGNSNAQGYDLTIGGALLGADIMPLKGLRLGAAVGYAHGDFDGDSNSGAGGIDSYQGLIYGRYDHGKFFFADAQAGYAFNNYDLSRGIAFSTINRAASSDADGHDVSAQLRIGAKLDSGGFNIVPSASLRYDRLQRDSFTETGADSLNLSVESKSFTALRSSIGARASYPLKLDENGIELEPYAGAYWQHDLRNSAVPVEARFSGIGIDVHGTDVGRDAAVLQIGAAAVLDEQFSLFAGYDAELRVRQTDHAISAGMRYRW
jgi:outer membrane autotransporter protein